MHFLDEHPIAAYRLPSAEAAAFYERFLRVFGGSGLQKGGWLTRLVWDGAQQASALALHAPILRAASPLYVLAEVNPAVEVYSASWAVVQSFFVEDHDQNDYYLMDSSMSWCLSISHDDCLEVVDPGGVFEGHGSVEGCHDEVVARAARIAASVRREDVSAAFLASLTRRRPELRSALGSYAVASRMPTHSHGGEEKCGQCGHEGVVTLPELSEWRAERRTWGGIRHGTPAYQAMDLELLASGDVPRPTEADRSALRAVLDAAATRPPRAGMSALQRALVGLFPSNEAERLTLLNILGLCGVLESKALGSFFEGWIPEEERRELGRWLPLFPVAWWRGADGVNGAAVSWWFPDLGWAPPRGFGGTGLGGGPRR